MNKDKPFGNIDLNKPDVNKWKIVSCAYGVITLLRILDRFEKEERYEECGHIKEAIEDIYPNLPTRLCEEAIDIIKRDFNLTDSYIERSYFYVEVALGDTEK